MNVEAELEEARLTAQERRRREERREANRIAWAVHYWRMAASHTQLAKDYTERAMELEKRSTNGTLG